MTGLVAGVPAWAVWLAGIISPLLAGVAIVMLERSRRKTYQMLLTEVQGGTLLLDTSRRGGSLLLIRDHDRSASTTVFVDIARQLPSP